MTNFMLVYTGGTIPDTKEKQDAVMAAWGAWYGKMGDAVVDGGNPFSNSKQISADGVKDSATISPSLTGYTVIVASSLDDAVTKIVDHPHLQYGGEISLYETFQM